MNSNAKKRIKQLGMLLILSLLVNMLQFSYIIYERKNDYQQVNVAQSAVGKLVQPSKNELVSYYEEKLCKLLDYNELKELASHAWDAVISVNGQEFRGNTQYINTDTMTILIAEILRDETLLPTNIAWLGCLEQDERKLTDYVKIYSEMPYNVERVEGTDGIKYYLKFENMPNGTIVTLQLSDKLKSRIHYQDQLAEDRLTIVKRMQ